MKKPAANEHVFHSAGLSFPADPMWMEMFYLTKLLISPNRQRFNWPPWTQLSPCLASSLLNNYKNTHQVALAITNKAMELASVALELCQGDSKELVWGFRLRLTIQRWRYFHQRRGRAPWQGAWEVLVQWGSTEDTPMTCSSQSPHSFSIRMSWHKESLNEVMFSSINGNQISA